MEVTSSSSEHTTVMLTSDEYKVLLCLFTNERGLRYITSLFGNVGTRTTKAITSLMMGFVHY